MAVTNEQTLNRAHDLEISLELLSFAGGENTISEDHVCKADEARVLQNWDSISLGGMERSKGFNLVSSGLNLIQAAVFTGAGLNDLTQGGTYSGTVTATFEVEIDGEGIPDTFKWKKDSGSYTETVAITGAAQTLSDGVTVTFAATTGHTSGNKWVIKAVAYSTALDLLIQHKDTGGTSTYGILEGDLVIQNGADTEQEDAAFFTTGVLSHGVSAGNKLWITNATDNLFVKENGEALVAVTDVPALPYSRVYNHKNRLLLEGNGKRVQGSRVGVGYWDVADTWTLANDAFSIDLPDDTRGCVPDFPSGDYTLVFTEKNAYAIGNFPNASFRAIGTPARGCGAPYSIAKGDEGVYFVSRYPTLGVFLFDGATFAELTELNRDVFVDKIDFSKRIFGVYRNRRYHLWYNEIGSGATYPNKYRIYDARFKRWMERPVNITLSDNFGYPTVLTFTNNELYVASSQKDKIYELETEDDSDEGLETIATYTTKNFSSRDFAVASGGQFPIDDCRLKLTKLTITYWGTTGNIAFYWAADRALHSGSKTIGFSQPGDVLNDTFIVNTSILGETPQEQTKTFTFPNSAVGKRFYFQINNSGLTDRPKVKKIKVSAIAFPEE